MSGRIDIQPRKSGQFVGIAGAFACSGFDLGLLSAADAMDVVETLHGAADRIAAIVAEIVPCRETLTCSRRPSCSARSGFSGSRCWSPRC
jgi:hypothetical protein